MIHTCKQCGINFKPKQQKHSTFCSRECAFKYRVGSNAATFRKPIVIERQKQAIADGYLQWANSWQVCLWCECPSYGTNTYCSENCSRKHNHFRHALLYALNREVKICVCKACGYEYCTNNQTRRMFCSKECLKDWHELVRRRRYTDAFVESVGIKYLIKRDNGICQICNEPCDLTAKVPNSLAPTVDHIIPLAKGGLHCRSNCQLAHFICNSIKSATI